MKSKPTRTHSSVQSPSRPTTLNPGAQDPRHRVSPEEKELERRLHRQVLKTIQETFGRD